MDKCAALAEIEANIARIKLQVKIDKAADKWAANEADGALDACFTEYVPQTVLSRIAPIHKRKYMFKWGRGISIMDVKSMLSDSALQWLDGVAKVGSRVTLTVVR